MKFDNPRFTTVYHRNAWGQWTFTFEGVKLCGLEFQGGANPGSPKACAYAEPESEGKVRGRTAQVYHSTIRELNLYLSGKLKKFSIPIKIYGTEFQTKVLEATMKIPYGKTMTYKELAEIVGHPRAERSVGNTLHNNPLQIVIPCHRVVSSRKGIGGYTLGTDLKRKLLCMEGAVENELDLE